MLCDTDNEVLPQSDVGGVSSNGQYIYLPHNWDGAAMPWGYSWTNSDAYRTIIHEFGHYAFYLYDEYMDAEGDKYPIDPDGIPEGPLGIMNYQYVLSELTTEIDYDNWDPPQGFSTTMQWAKNGESCWQTVFRKYNYYGGEYIRGVLFDLDGNGVSDTTYFQNYIAGTFGTPYPVGEHMFFFSTNF